MVGEPGHRSAAEEIAEGVLISAQREHEERKLPYIGNLVAGFAFEPAISRSEANLFLRLANDLSYRQLCVIAILSQKERFPYLRNADYPDWPNIQSPSGVSLPLLGLLTEMAELVARGMLSQEVRITPTESAINPSRTDVIGWAGGLYRLMRLGEIPEEDLTQVAHILAGSNG